MADSPQLPLFDSGPPQRPSSKPRRTADQGTANSVAGLRSSIDALKEAIDANLSYLQALQEKTQKEPPVNVRKAQEAQLSEYQKLQLQSQVELPPKVSSYAPTPYTALPQTLSQKVTFLRKSSSDNNFRTALGQVAGRIPYPTPLETDTAPIEEVPSVQQQPSSGQVQTPTTPQPQPSGPMGLDVNNPNRNASMLSWAVLGEHGGPSFVRNLAFEQWGLENSLKWAQNNFSNWAQSMPNNFNFMGINSQNLQTASDMMTVAMQHPFLSYGAYKGFKSLGTLSQIGQGWQSEGAALGGQVTSDRYFMGLRNPLAPLMSGATSIGMGAAINRRQLEGQLPGGMGMGSGLSSSEAQGIINEIMGQGFGGNENQWGQGDIGTIANQFMGPLMQKFPGLSASDMGQFIPLLRNSGTSLKQLTSVLSDLGTAAKATHETVGAAASTLMAFAEQTKGMGSAQGALESAQGFRNITGMDPQIQAQLLQNPLTQGLALSHGILPSALNDMGAAGQTALSTQALQMWMKAMGGFHAVNTTINGVPVHISAQQQKLDQVAQMMGISVQQANELLSRQKGNTAREQLYAGLGSSSQGFIGMTRGGAGHETKAEIDQAQQYWMKNVASHWQGTGIGQKEMERLSHMGFKQRISALKNDLNNVNAQDSWNAVQSGPSSQTVHVAFTGAAARYFQQVGPTTAKQAANSGALNINSVTNSINPSVASAWSGNPTVAVGSNAGVAYGGH